MMVCGCGRQRIARVSPPRAALEGSVLCDPQVSEPGRVESGPWAASTVPLGPERRLSADDRRWSMQTRWTGKEKMRINKAPPDN